MVVSRIYNSKGVEIKEEGIVNQVLESSTTGLQIAKSIRHAKQKRWSEDKIIFFSFCFSWIFSISYPLSLNLSYIKQCYRMC